MRAIEEATNMKVKEMENLLMRTITNMEKDFKDAVADVSKIASGALAIKFILKKQLWTISAIRSMSLETSTMR